MAMLHKRRRVIGYQSHCESDSINLYKCEECQSYFPTIKSINEHFKPFADNLSDMTCNNHSKIAECLNENTVKALKTPSVVLKSSSVKLVDICKSSPRKTKSTFNNQAFGENISYDIRRKVLERTYEYSSTKSNEVPLENSSENEEIIDISSESFSDDDIKKCLEKRPNIFISKNSSKTRANKQGNEMKMDNSKDKEISSILKSNIIEKDSINNDGEVVHVKKESSCIDGLKNTSHEEIKNNGTVSTCTGILNPTDSMVYIKCEETGRCIASIDTSTTLSEVNVDSQNVVHQNEGRIDYVDKYVTTHDGKVSLGPEVNIKTKRYPDYVSLQTSVMQVSQLSEIPHIKNEKIESNVRRGFVRGYIKEEEADTLNESNKINKSSNKRYRYSFRKRALRNYGEDDNNEDLDGDDDISEDLDDTNHSELGRGRHKHSCEERNSKENLCNSDHNSTASTLNCRHKRNKFKGTRQHMNSFSENLEESNMIHSEISDSIKSYHSCDKCNAQLSSRNCYINHMILYHHPAFTRKDLTVCPICFKSYDSYFNSKLRHHVTIKHSLDEMKCLKCNCRFDTIIDLQKHILVCKDKKIRLNNNERVRACKLQCKDCKCFHIYRPSEHSEDVIRDILKSLPSAKEVDLLRKKFDTIQKKWCKEKTIKLRCSKCERTFQKLSCAVNHIVIFHKQGNFADCSIVRFSSHVNKCNLCKRKHSVVLKNKYKKRYFQKSRFLDRNGLTPSKLDTLNSSDKKFFAVIKDGLMKYLGFNDMKSNEDKLSCSECNMVIGAFTCGLSHIFENHFDVVSRNIFLQSRFIQRRGKSSLHYCKSSCRSRHRFNIRGRSWFDYYLSRTFDQTIDDESLSQQERELTMETNLNLMKLDEFLFIENNDKPCESKDGGVLRISSAKTRTEVSKDMVYRIVHINGYFYCQICQSGFKQISCCKNHVLTEHSYFFNYQRGSEVYTCLICKNNFHSLHLLNGHFDQYHNTHNFICMKCDKKFNTCKYDHFKYCKGFVKFIGNKMLFCRDCGHVHNCIVYDTEENLIKSYSTGNETIFSNIRNIQTEFPEANGTSSNRKTISKVKSIDLNTLDEGDALNITEPDKESSFRSNNVEDLDSNEVCLSFDSVDASKPYIENVSSSDIEGGSKPDDKDHSCTGIVEKSKPVGNNHFIHDMDNRSEYDGKEHFASGVEERLTYDDNENPMSGTKKRSKHDTDCHDSSEMEKRSKYDDKDHIEETSNPDEKDHPCSDMEENSKHVEKDHSWSETKKRLKHDDNYHYSFDLERRSKHDNKDHSLSDVEEKSTHDDNDHSSSGMEKRSQHNDKDSSSSEMEKRSKCDDKGYISSDLAIVGSLEPLKSKKQKSGVNIICDAKIENVDLVNREFSKPYQKSNSKQDKEINPDVAFDGKLFFCLFCLKKFEEYPCCFTHVLSMHYVSSVFTCNICFETRQLRVAYISHLKKNHNLDSCYCGNCCKGFDNIDIREKHMISCKNPKVKLPDVSNRYVCKKCFAVHVNVSDYRKASCEECEQGFASISCAKNHFFMKHFPSWIILSSSHTKFRCQCEKVVLTKADLKLHLLTEHKLSKDNQCLEKTCHTETYPDSGDIDYDSYFKTFAESDGKCIGCGHFHIIDAKDVKVNNRRDTKCKVCKKTFLENLCLKNHILNSHGYKYEMRQCVGCGLYCAGSAVLERHQSYKPSVDQHKICKKEEGESSGIECRQSVCLLECDKCGEMHQHKFMIEESKIYDAKSPQEFKEERNKRIQNEKPTFICRICDLVVENRRLLAEHIKCFHEKIEDRKGDFCQVCKKQIESNVYYSDHLKQEHCTFKLVEGELFHDFSRNFSCFYCKETFSFAMDVQMHLRIKHFEKPLVARKHFNLEVNSSIIAGQRTVHCPLCLKPCKYFIIQHIKQHFPRLKKHEEHVCDICGKIFKDSLLFKDHKNKHNGTRTYKCTICEKSFLYNSNLQTHKQVHKEKKEECKECGMKFTLPHHLRAHMKRKHPC